MSGLADYKPNLGSGHWAVTNLCRIPLLSLAHSLQGSSATVGFSALSSLGRALEHALEHVQLHRAGTPEIASVCLEAAEDIRRLLHQFAAGFLKEPTPGLQDALQAITDTEFLAPAGEADLVGLDDVLPTDSAFVPTAVVAEVPSLDPVPAQEAAAVETVAESAVHSMVMAAPLAVVEAEDEDLDAVDNLDEDLFPIFQEEATRVVAAIGRVAAPVDGPTGGPDRPQRSAARFAHP